MNILEKLIKIIDYNIIEHSLQIEDIDLKEESLKHKISKGRTELNNKDIKSTILIKELIMSKDKILQHKAAIAELNDIKGIIQDALKQI